MENHNVWKHLDLTMLLTNLLMCFTILCLYMVGVHLNYKIVQVSKKDKHISWKIDAMNSILTTLHFVHVVTMDQITHIINDVYRYTGSWFCYTSKALTFLGNSHMTQFSLIVALEKLIMIVFHERARVIGKERIQNFFLGITVCFPIYLMGILSILRPDFIFVYDGISHANRCLGKSDVSSSQNFNQSAIKLHNICDFDDEMDTSYYSTIVLKKFFCWSHIVLMYFNAWNVLEFVVYCIIFAFMKRYFCITIILHLLFH